MSEAEGERVMSRASAEPVGKVRHVVIDPASRRIVAVHVDGRKKKAQLVDWSSITGFGPDSVMVESEDALRAPREGHELDVASGRLDLKGRMVLGDDGVALGDLADIEFDEGSGDLLALVVGERSLDAARLRAIGSYCLLVTAEPAPAG